MARTRKCAFSTLVYPVWLAALVALPVGCGDDSSPTPGDSKPQVTDALDAGPKADKSVVDSTVPDGPLPWPRPVAPVKDPEPLPIKEWMAAAIKGGSGTMAGVLEKGTFTYPAKGKAYGLDWSPLTPSTTPPGEITSMLPWDYVLYAATKFDLPAGKRLFGRFDSIYTVYMNTVPMPADLYGFRQARIPLLAKETENLLVVEGTTYRIKPEVELWTTEDEVVFNLKDATLPHLRVGDKSELWVGVPVLNLTDTPVLDLSAKVEESAQFEATEVTIPGIGPGSVTQVPFKLVQKAAVTAPKQKVTVALRLESKSLAWTYRRELELDTVAADVVFRRTFRSAMDGSVQYYGVVPPKSFDPAKEYALVLSLHGASVEAEGQAGAYSQRDWTYVVAATNRRPYGFDWEEFGRVEGMETLDHAMSSFKIAKDKVYVAGHSMGGHGTYHFGIHFPGRFAAIAPSAGWGSFESYGGDKPATGVIGRARAASNTFDYLSNLARRGAYILQGSADDNVSAAEAHKMRDALQAVTSDLIYHEVPGQGHWWDGDNAPGVDCVDWVPLFDFLKAHTLDPTELTFKFTSPSPWVSPTHSYVTMLSETDANQDLVVESSVSGDTVTLTTTNVRSMIIDGAALQAKSIAKIIIDGKEQAVTGAAITVGPQTGKRPGVHGPLNQAFHRPFCFVYSDTGPVAYSRYAAYLAATWAIYGNGASCTVPLANVKAETRSSYNLVYLGVPSADVKPASSTQLEWSGSAVKVGGKEYKDSALTAVFPEGDRLSAVFTAASGSEYLVFRYHPFTSRSGMPDYFVWSSAGGTAAGFFSPEWAYTGK